MIKTIVIASAAAALLVAPAAFAQDNSTGAAPAKTTMHKAHKSHKKHSAMSSNSMASNESH